METSETRATRLGLELVSLPLVFDLQSSGTDLAAAAMRQAPLLSSVLRTLNARTPVPRTVALEGEQHFYRLAGHNRSFCYALTDGDDVFDCPSIVFKGVESICSDFERFVDWMTRAPLRASSRVMADHFPLGEGKIPGVLSLKEALEEASIAQEIQTRHLQVYGELARLPLPLRVHRLPEPDVERCHAALRRRLSAAALRRVEPLLQDGLGVYVYYYPAAPVRANAQGSGGGPRLMKYIKERRPEEVIARWIQLLARLFHLGYLPCTPRSDGLGACMDPGNAALDGGFCDPDSIEPIASAPDDEFVFESVAVTVMGLQRTVTQLVSPTFGMSLGGLYPDIQDFTMGRYVAGAFERALASEGRPGLTLDARVLRLLSPRDLDDVRLCIERKKRPHTYAAFLRASP